LQCFTKDSELLMSNTEIEIVVDDPTALEADSPVVTVSAPST